MATASEPPNRRGRTDHYAVLGVARGADTATIRRAWIAAARRWHPDRLGEVDERDRQRAAARIVEVNEAWRILSDPKLRAAHDRSTAAAAAPPDQHRADRRRAEPPPPDAPAPGMQVVVESRRTALFVRALPWVLGAAFLVALLALTAQGTSERGDEPVPFRAVCANLTADPFAASGFAVQYVQCSRTHSARTVRPTVVDGTVTCEASQHAHVRFGELFCFDGRILD